MRAAKGAQHHSNSMRCCTNVVTTEASVYFLQCISQLLPRSAIICSGCIPATMCISEWIGPFQSDGSDLTFDVTVPLRVPALHRSCPCMCHTWPGTFSLAGIPRGIMKDWARLPESINLALLFSTGPNSGGCQARQCGLLLISKWQL